ncbi:outer membrane beta-barrel protein [Flavobacterium sp. WC2509]|uniref:outer membrane beta-barrel protein n=1 Tax=Flavobacterium sp. WC2509 TaxID=3461406 RepID=UPI004044A46E
MTKNYFSLLFFLFFFAVNAQNNIVIKGTVHDNSTQKPLESAMVYFSTVQDSTVIEYTTTDKNGDFKIATKKYDKPVFLKINFIGYQVYSEVQNRLIENKDFGKLFLLEDETLLNEVVIKRETPPILVKKDTLEFNAASYKVRPDANLGTLLRQLPGIEVDSDGKITANGKEVTQFLVNGKSFFGKDGAIALKNLPADIINKIQLSDFKTKKEELSKEASTSDYSSINITIDEKKNKGYFGKVIGGYGTDDRYENSLILNYFNNKQKISLLALANNINSAGFAMDEVFDNMAGGRNTKLGARSTGRGITTSNMVGLNYSNEWKKNSNATASYDFSNTINENESKSTQADFRPTGAIFTDANSKTRNENTGNKADLEFDYKINPMMRLVVAPAINQSRSNNRSESYSSAKDENGVALNETKSGSYRESTNANFENSINFNKSFERRSRNLSFVFNNNNSNSDSDALNMSKTIFYQGSRPDDERNQNVKSNNSNASYSTDIEYTEPITDSLRIRLGSEFGWRKDINDLKTYDRDSISNTYSILNNLQSNYTTSSQNSIAPKVGLSFEKNKFTFNLSSRTSIVDYDNHSLYLNKPTDLNQKYILPYGNAQIGYRFKRSKTITLRYDYSSSLPSSNQLMPVANLSNPLNSVVGNPNLNLTERNSVNLNYRSFNVRSRSGYNLYARADFFDNQVVSTTIYDPVLDSNGDIEFDSNGKPKTNGKRTTTFRNVTGTYNSSAGGSWNQTLRRNAHVFKYGLGLNENYSLAKGFTNTILYSTKSLGLSPRVNFSYDYGELFTVAPTYTLSYNESRYTNSSLTASSNVVHAVNVQITNYWPENWVWGNDFGYTYNSKISNDFKKDFYLWNTSLSYAFLDKKMLLKVKVYDVLNQNQSATRTISPTRIRDEENTVLKRYGMFSLTYKIGSFGSKDKEGKKKMRI